MVTTFIPNSWWYVCSGLLFLHHISSHSLICRFHLWVDRFNDNELESRMCTLPNKGGDFSSTDISHRWITNKLTIVRWCKRVLWLILYVFIRMYHSYHPNPLSGLFYGVWSPFKTNYIRLNLILSSVVLDLIFKGRVLRRITSENNSPPPNLFEVISGSLIYLIPIHPPSVHFPSVDDLRVRTYGNEEKMGHSS